MYFFLKFFPTIFLDISIKFLLFHWWTKGIGGLNEWWTKDAVPTQSRTNTHTNKQRRQLITVTLNITQSNVQISFKLMQFIRL